jgi:hypothetical protein
METFEFLFLRGVDRAFWICTVWTDEAAMRPFMGLGAQRLVMSRWASWCDGTALVHWVHDGPKSPS